jgi:hypothetical protein
LTATLLTHCDRGKPQGCLEPAKTVLKGKPHAFESWSGYLHFFHFLFDTPSLYLLGATSMSHNKFCLEIFGLSQPAGLPATKNNV